VSWSTGYISDVTYTHGYYRELSPTILSLCLLWGRFSPLSTSVRYLELGFGQGLSLNIHAAAVDGEF
jgi:hypothetical protein